MQLSQKQAKAARELVKLIVQEVGENGAVHAGTAVASGARLSGSFLFRSFNLQVNNIPPGSPILSQQANEKGIMLINVLGFVLSSFHIQVEPNKFKTTLKADSFISFIDTLNLLQDKAAAIMKRYELSFEETAYSCVMATAYLIKECQHDLSIEVGFNTALYGFIEETKTYPPELLTINARKKSFFSFWNKDYNKSTRQ